ncbi:sensor kinase dpiB [Escherichia coli]|uniref:Sensor kinase dpiB n=1 Tax=Escherichia coli TaxID=562 RepID=A0A2X1NGF7_ECOLX|nr:sensor kinase dpiB [Escherichia coli]
MLLSWFLAAHIRRQMMGMEPKQIARVVRQQEALFSSVYEGLIAVDPHGYITAINRNARKILGLSSPGRQWLGKPIVEVVRPPISLPNRLMKNVRMWWRTLTV